MDTGNMSVLKHRFFSIFTQDEIPDLIEDLVKDTQTKFMADLPQDKIDDLMLELKAIQKLRTMMMVWFNNEEVVEMTKGEEE